MTLKPSPNPSQREGNNILPLTLSENDMQVALISRIEWQQLNCEIEVTEENHK
jgi:hypothetical protein